MTIRLCRDCVHYQRPLLCGSEKINGINLVDGSVIERFAETNRQNHAYCGPSGVGFEQKPPSVIQMFGRWVKKL